MKNVKMMVHYGNKSTKVEIMAEKDSDAVAQVMSELYYGVEQANGDIEVIVTAHVTGFTILNGAGK